MFFDNYDTPVFRPPSEAYSFILRVTRGCAHNKCTYCNMYRGVQFQVLTDEEILRQVALAQAHNANGVRRVFLADGDALVLSTERLLRVLKALRYAFPNLERVSSYAAPKDILRKSPEELRQLQEAGLKLLYYGMETGDSETLNYIEANKIPCVLVDRLTSTKFDRVGIQNRHAMGLVVDHLADHGHQRIGFISGQPGFATAIERTEGFRAALSERGLAVDEALIRSGDSIDGAAAAAAELLARPDRPSALAVGNNMSMIGVMRAIRSAGLSVPGDIALVGFDDFEWADCFEPRLTVIAQPVEEIGRKAAELLVRRIAADQSEEPLKPQIIRLKPTLVIRESCGCRA